MVAAPESPPPEPEPAKKRTRKPKAEKPTPAPAPEPPVVAVAELELAPAPAPNGIVAGWLAELEAKWAAWTAAFVARVFLGGTLPGSVAPPGGLQWMGCVKTPAGMADMLRTPSRVENGKEMGAAIVPHVFFLAPRGTTPVCERCAAGGKKISLSPIHLEEVGVPVATPVMPDVPRLRELGMCAGPVPSGPVVTGLRNPACVVIYADFPSQPVSDAEAAEIVRLEAQESLSQRRFPSGEDEGRVKVRLDIPFVDVFAEEPEPVRPPMSGRPKPYVPATYEAWLEEYNERAAIMHFVGGSSEKAADIAARQLVGPPPKRDLK